MPTSDGAILLALDQFNRAIEVMRRRLRDFEDGSADLSETVKSWDALARATDTLLKYRAKLDEHKRTYGNGPELDLDMARDRIGSLLDRLRAARDSGGVS